MKKLILTLAAIVAGITLTRANIVPLGEIDFSGEFTVHHDYDYNHPDLYPFGTFEPQTVTSATGIFDGVNGILSMFDPNMELPMTWNVSGFEFITNNLIIAGPDSGRLCFGTISQNSPNFAYWQFIAPPFDIGNFHEDITGPINLMIAFAYEDGHVPDTGSTAALLGLGLIALASLKAIKL